MGTLVCRAVKSKKILIYIDDGTGVIECVKFFSEKEFEKALPYTSLSLGDCVVVRGKIIFYNG